MSEDEFEKLVADELASRGGELITTSSGRSCGLATPFGLVRFVLWRGVLVAHLLAYPDSQRGDWYGFDRWKQSFEIWKRNPDLDRRVMAEQLADWVNRYFEPGPKGFPDGSMVYNTELVLCCSWRHAPRDLLATPHAAVARVGGNVMVWLDAATDPERFGWLREIADVAKQLRCGWVCFKPGLKADPRFTVMSD